MKRTVSLPGDTSAPTCGAVTGTVSGRGKKDEPEARKFSYRWLPPQIIGGRYS
ncbi:hypothetical protein NFT50_004376 [Salmonella enterica]|nr:hypothetical protein [Salmonella enterica]EJH7441110.1 hypothetical protein [Salmonella enterica]EJH7880479.1 hypothetical protein [Salmonella enterica]EJI6713228.1 hypothetical protein [Salmonella enterica]